MGETSVRDLIQIPHINRKSTSIYIDSYIFKAFYKRCREIGTTSCSVLEAFMFAYVKGTSGAPGSPIPNVTVNLNINRVVRRALRNFSNSDVPIVKMGSFSKCSVCESLPVVKANISEIHQESERYLCEDHFYEHLDSYKKISWLTIRDFTWSHKWK